MAERFEIPEKCIGCPVLDECLNELSVADSVRQDLQSSAARMMEEGAIDGYLYLLNEMLHLTPMQRELYRQQSLRESGTSLDSLDARIEHLERRRNDLIATCTGLVTTTALWEMDRHVYETDTCSSEIAHEPSKEDEIDESARDRTEFTEVIFPARVRRREF